MTIATDELQRIVADVAEDRCVGTEDHWWHSQVCDFYLDEDFGAHDGQKAADRRRILRIPALERAAAEVIRLRARVEAARQLAEAAADFANAKIEALRFDMTGLSPEDEPDPVVEAGYVWALQSDMKDALAAWEAGQ